MPRNMGLNIYNVIGIILNATWLKPILNVTSIAATLDLQQLPTQHLRIIVYQSLSRDIDSLTL